MKLFVERFIGEQARFACIEHGKLRIDTKLVKMFAHEFEAKTVERADVRRIEECELFGTMSVIGIFRRFFFERAAKALAHFGRGGFGESGDENFVERCAFANDAVQTSLDERVRFARARAGHDEHVAARDDSLLLRRRQARIIFIGRIHLLGASLTRGRNVRQFFRVPLRNEWLKTSRMAEGLRLKDQPASERPRERLVALGADALSHAELIAILLRTGLKGANAVEVGRQLLQKFGTLQSLAQASIQDLQRVKGIGRDKAVTLVAAFALARKMAGELQRESPVLDNPENVVQLLREQNLLKSVETLQVLLLNTRHKLIRVEEISDGTLDTILVHPREVFKSAIAANAHAVVLVHNHPSGDPTPSEADVKVTRDLIRAGKLLKIEVLDHVIIGRATAQRQKDYASLRELGYFYS
jgi:DNA repair protein RadC